MPPSPDVGSLVSWGWDDAWAAAFTERVASLAGAGQGRAPAPPSPSRRPGRITRVDRGECDVVTPLGAERALSDSTRAQGLTAPTAGDWVVVEDDGGTSPVLGSILERRTRLARRDPAVAEEEQVLVANADQVGVVCGLDRPLRVGRIERFVVLALDGGSEPVVILTKADHGQQDESWSDLAAELPGVAVVRTSAVTGEGIRPLADRLRPARTLALVGESGAGKSRLVNALVGADVQVVGDQRRDAKGRHTTRARELILLPTGGVLVDTPGVRGVGLWDARPALGRVFADIATAARDCRFSDCTHRREPGCAVLTAVADGRIEPIRLARYQRLVDELDDQDVRRTEQGRLPRRRGRRRG